MPCGARFGTGELMLLALLVILLFGASRLPEIGRGLGVGIRRFRKGLKDESGDDEDDADTHADSSSGRRRGK